MDSIAGKTIDTRFGPTNTLCGQIMAERELNDELHVSDDSVWIVVPAYNEADRIGKTLSQLCRIYTDVAVVDDGSSDDTAAVIDQFPVWRLTHVVNFGQGAALQTGIDFALGRGADILVTFDADGQHCEDDIANLLRPIHDGKTDVALGSRFLGSTVGIPWTRYVTLKLGVCFTRLFSRIRVTDTHNGLRAMSAQAARRIRLSHNGMAHASEFLDEVRRHGLRYCEVPVTVRYSDDVTKKGQTSWNSLRIVSQLLIGRITR